MMDRFSPRICLAVLAGGVALSWLVAFVTLALWWVRRNSPDVRASALFILGCLGLTLGAVMVTNTWSTFTYVPFLPFLLGTTFLARRHGGVFRWLWHAITQVVLPTVVTCALAVALYVPYWRSWTPPESNWGWEHDAFAHLWDFVNIFGLFLFIAVPFLFAVWRGVLIRFGTIRLTWAQAIFSIEPVAAIDVRSVASAPAGSAAHALRSGSRRERR